VRSVMRGTDPRLGECGLAADGAGQGVPPDQGGAVVRQRARPGCDHSASTSMRNRGTPPYAACTNDVQPVPTLLPSEAFQTSDRTGASMSLMSMRRILAAAAMALAAVAATAVPATQAG